VKKLRLSIFAIAFVLVLAGVLSAQSTTRIKFKRGAVSSVVAGYLSGYTSKKTYVIKVRSGQTLRTEQIGSSHNITIFIKDPNGEDVSDADASCNNRKEISPTVAGDYKITVVQCQKADEWRGNFRFRVMVR